MNAVFRPGAVICVTTVYTGNRPGRGRGDNDMIKSIIATAVAVSFLGAMGVAQAGVPASQPSNAAATASANASAPQPQSSQSNSQQPAVPGASGAQSQAMSAGTKVAIGSAIVAGVLLVFGTGDDGGNSTGTTPGTGGTTGSTGTTGTTGTH